jgi:hypothetical protein
MRLRSDALVALMLLLSSSLLAAQRPATSRRAGERLAERRHVLDGAHRRLHHHATAVGVHGAKLPPDDDLIRSADVAFTNLEMLFHDYEPYAMNQSGGTYMRAEPALAKELVLAGFDLVSRANNHTGDYGVEGMRLTTTHVAAAELVPAGIAFEAACRTMITAMEILVDNSS